jgi:anti-sigma factor RsiW
MSCRKFRTMILLGREGELTDGEARELAEHLTVCPSCAAEEASLAEMAALMQRAHDIPVEPPDPEGLTSRILGRVATMPRTVARTRATSLIDRLFDVIFARSFRLASALAIALVTGMFMWQYFSILGDMRNLEAQQMRAETAHTLPQVGYAVDTRPLRGTPAGALLDRLDGRRAEGSVVVMDRTFESWRESTLRSQTLFSKSPLSVEESQALSRLVLYFTNTARPTLCFVTKGA